MRRSMIFVAAIAAQCALTGVGHAKQVQVKLTSQQVETTCGSLIVNAGSYYGCKKSCGDGKTCGFSCEKGGKNCKGVVVQRAGSPPGSASSSKNDIRAIKAAVTPSRSLMPKRQLTQPARQLNSKATTTTTRIKQQPTMAVPMTTGSPKSPTQLRR
jgi:hypothetical protein